MADPPRPPPLPPLPLRSITRPGEPFRDLTAEDRAADTQRTRRDELPPPALDALTETTAQLLRQELALMREVTRESLPTLPGVPTLAPDSVRTRSKAAVAAMVGKFGAVGVLVAIVVLRAIVKRWPATAPVIEPILDGLGL